MRVLRDEVLREGGVDVVLSERKVLNCKLRTARYKVDASRPETKSSTKHRSLSPCTSTLAWETSYAASATL